MSDTAVKHTVNTDALETLGSIIGAYEKRDAIHIAVEPVTAVGTLHPGQHVGKANGGFGISSIPVGIVDPFLTQEVQHGERFWLLVYPRQITSLRHVWSHPAFGEAEVYAEPQKTDSSMAVARAEEWLRDFCDNLGSDVSYEDIIRTALDDGRYGYGYDSLCFGDEISGDIPAEFWNQLEILSGKKIASRPSYFRCAC